MKLFYDNSMRIQIKNNINLWITGNKIFKFIGILSHGEYTHTLYVHSLEELDKIKRVISEEDIYDITIDPHVQYHTAWYSLNSDISLYFSSIRMSIRTWCLDDYKFRLREIGFKINDHVNSGAIILV